MNKKILASVTALTLVFGAVGAVIPNNDVFGTGITASAMKAEQGKCGEDLAWTKSEDGVITIKGSGQMTSRGFNESTACTKVIVDGAENILPESFKYFNKLTDISLSGSVAVIGEEAFYSCKKITGMEFSEGVKEIGDRAFYKCDKMKSATLNNKDTKIGYLALGYYEKTGGHLAKVKDFTIYGYKGSTAEKYAEENEFIFVALSGDAPEDNTITKGDVNLDGEINVTDIAMVASHIKGIKALTGDGLKAADVNADGDINVTDIAMIASHIKGIKALQ